MDSYLLFLAIATATIASPGPGVVLTISNALRYGVRGAVSGIMGIASGMLIIAVLSASSLAVLMLASATAFTIVKFIGATYLIYLGIKMWRTSTNLELKQQDDQPKEGKRKYLEGLLLTLLNPKPILFFIALFPQFISGQENYLNEFMGLALSFGALVIVIHMLYASFTVFAGARVSITNGRKVFNRIGGSLYIFFGTGLALSKRVT